MKNILVPTDFSETAKNALKFAIKIAHPLKNKIILFHTERPILIANEIGMYAYPEIDEESNNLILNEKMDELLSIINANDLEGEKIIQSGLLVDNIVELTETKPIDLIVTGTHGAKGLEAFVYGTNSDSIFEKVKCPVLIVPAEAKYHGIKKIMYATDFEFGDIHELEKISKLARIFNAQIVVTHINPNADEFEKEQETMDWFSEIGDSTIPYKNIVYKLIYDKNVTEALENAIKDLNIDILCMSIVERDFFENIFSKSNIKEMEFHSTIPLMAIHIGKENQLN